jgi:pimeloyl-ACP methyl ester carboxylesterase
MRRGWKILIGVLVALVVLLALNAVATDEETRSAEVTVAGGEILQLSGGDLQVVDRGPRDASPIVLIHCFTCAIDWWDRLMPRLTPSHRVIAVDLLGHGGSEKPDSGYSIPRQADLVAQALSRLGVRNAEVVGHSLGGSVAVALAEQSPQLVNRIVIVDTAPTHEEGDLGLIANLAFAPVIGEAFWRIKPDFAVRNGLGVAFAPGFDVPDEFVDDVDRMTFSAYDDSASSSQDYSTEVALDERVKATGKPLLVIMGAEEQIVDDPQAALDAYSETVPGALTNLIDGAGHSPNVEAPAETAALVLGFAEPPKPPPTSRSKDGAAKRRAQAREGGPSKGELQDGVQNRSTVRGQS